ncbi:MAG: prepilin-type N-terminal cleavage/methylation domain-containing protein [Opitutaceae bacterium]|nr:prepilin-type N-terminal cleavage/methylation domain-containing protein [Opitutaceae bacterium]
MAASREIPAASANPPRHGFTLVELLAVLVIIGLLVGLVLGIGRYAINSGKTSRATAELAVLSAALETYRQQQGDFPRTADGALLLQALLGRRDPLNRNINSRSLIDLARFTTVNGRDPRQDPGAQLADPWGQPYVYAYRTVTPWSNVSYVLQSAGPNGLISSGLRPGGFIDIAHEANADNVLAPR